MAQDQDGDIIDYLMGLIFEFFGWSLKVIVKFGWLITIGIITGIISLIKKLCSKKSENVSEETSSDIQQ